MAEYYRVANGSVWFATKNYVLGINAENELCAVDSLTCLTEEHGPLERVYPNWSTTPPPREYAFGDRVRVVGADDMHVVTQRDDDSEPQYLLARSDGNVYWARTDRLTPWEESP